MATLRRSGILLAGAAVLLAAAPAASIAAEPLPTPGGQPARATCAERFPAEEGPAGVDLRLGCIAGEIVGLYTAGSGEPPAPISSWALVLGLGVATVSLAGWLATRALSRRAGQRLAPVLAQSWWVCEACRSVNGTEKRRCYSCGAPASGGPAMATSDSPETPQSFGGQGKR